VQDLVPVCVSLFTYQGCLESLSDGFEARLEMAAVIWFCVR